MTEWQPIATAPKTGCAVVGFMPAPKPYGFQEDFDEVAVIFWKGNGWRYQHDDHLWAEPTHWLEIPPYPT